MRDFSWQVFTMTGNVDAYLLFKDLHAVGTDEEQEEDAAELVAEWEG
ncbi:YqzL family protein [Xylanibacillus composti]|uniref:YqzL family protein n=1 Tax=Xylanibacillus composti TaxID=1572762 RepID=A0A8J4H1S5_9BACL|nr:YqzL family protein [Xylanibacillus composti]MDT9724415.1 YqzL family protein [Xylanibacillus composti]GIQ68011.1 hypothetical protein XYCOK13_08350 [Xylanibacillus composti]